MEKVFKSLTIYIYLRPEVIKVGCFVKVLLVNLRPYVQVQGGMEKIFCEMSNALVERGFQVVFIGADSKKGLPYFNISPEVRLYNIGNVAVRKSLTYKIKRMLYGNKKRRHSYDNAANSCLKAEMLRPVFDIENPDIVICFSVKDAYVINGYMDINCPSITMFHSPPKVVFEYIDFDYHMMEATGKSDCLQVLLDVFVDEAKKFITHPNIRCIPNAVSPPPEKLWSTEDGWQKYYS